MDGVITDSEPVHQQLEHEMYQTLGLNIHEEELKNYVGTSSIDMWTSIGQKYGLDKTPEEMLHYGRQKYWDALASGAVPLVQGVMELIKKLKNHDFVLQVASSATRPTVERVISHFELDAYFHHRIGGDEVSRSKPFPEIFLKAAAQSNSTPHQCLVIEDSTNGIRAAKKAGMYCIGYQNPNTGQLDLTQADAVVSALSEISIEMITSLPR